MTKVKKDETVVLIDSNFSKFLINTNLKVDKYKGIGVFDPKSLVGKELGRQLEIGSKKFWILKPSLMDKLEGLKRKAQIILPRDAAQIIMNCSIESGQKVLEAGIGSGSLTIAIATAVAPNGKIISYDTRQDFIDHSIKNLIRANVEKFVEVKLKDVTKGISEKNLDAVTLDIPNPYDAIEHAFKALKPGGYLCTYSPLTSQVEKTIQEIKKYSFIEIKTFENIQRRMVVSEHGMRPSFDMLGHTGYLTFARKVY
jgi:tRNA (adenine57-N1/adenine58-N1)-methyltransferase catalytic subunit